MGAGWHPVDAMSQPPSLAEQLEALVQGTSRPSWDEYFMATAVLVSSR